MLIEYPLPTWIGGVYAGNGTLCALAVHFFVRRKR